MIKEEVAIEVRVSNQCSCVFCPECSMGFCNTDACEECGGEVQYLEDCFDCQPVDYAQELFESWVERVGAKQIRIDGRGMGWQRRSGYAIVEASWVKFLESITFNGDWTLYFTFDGDSFTFSRSSHDEYGAAFEVRRLRPLRESIDLDKAIATGLVDDWGCHKSCGVYWEEDTCEGEEDK